MNAHQRRKQAAAHHYRMPLGCFVRVYTSGDRSTHVDGMMDKHDSGRCIVVFAEHNALTLAANPEAIRPSAWVSYARVRPLGVNRVRPWWRAHRERLGLAANSKQAWGRK